MKRLLIILFVLSTRLIYGQKISIGLLQNNVIYLGIETEFDFAVENHNCTEYILQSDNGSIKNIKENIFSIYPKHLGVATIYFINMKGDTIFRKEFRVKKIPDPEILIGKFKEPFGTLIPTIEAFIDLDLNIKITIASFKLDLIRDSSIIKSYFINGYRFDKEYDEIKLIKHENDKLIFKEIKLIYPDKTEKVIETTKMIKLKT